MSSILYPLNGIYDRSFKASRNGRFRVVVATETPSLGNPPSYAYYKLGYHDSKSLGVARKRIKDFRKFPSPPDKFEFKIFDCRGTKHSIKA